MTPDQKLARASAEAFADALAAVQQASQSLIPHTRAMAGHEELTHVAVTMGLLGAVLAIVGASADADMSDRRVPSPRLTALYGAVRRLPHVQELLKAE